MSEEKEKMFDSISEAISTAQKRLKNLNKALKNRNAKTICFEALYIENLMKYIEENSLALALEEGET